MIPDGRPSSNGAGPPDDEGDEPGPREDELAAVLDAYLAEVEAGRPVDPEEWVRRHPVHRRAAPRLPAEPAPGRGRRRGPGRRTRTGRSGPRIARRIRADRRGTTTAPGSAISASSASWAAAAWASSTRPWRARWAAAWR